MVIWFCLQVHVSMHGQEALFSENMPLKEVITHLEQQKAAATPTEENVRALLAISTDMATSESEGWTEEGCCVDHYLCTVSLAVLFSQDMKIQKMAAKLSGMLVLEIVILTVLEL